MVSNTVLLGAQHWREKACDSPFMWSVHSSGQSKAQVCYLNQMGFYFIGVCVSVCATGMCVEVKGQLYGVGFLLS